MGGKLPLEGLVANSIWAVVNGGLALAVLSFTAKVQSHTRADYRFPVPLVAELVLNDGRRVCGTVDDLSDGGMRFYGALPGKLAVGAPITGMILLPDGPMALWGEVRSLVAGTDSGDSPRAIGCSFSAATQGRHRLEAFLFGSDLQWHVNGYTDQVHTPLSRLMPRWVRGPRPHPLADQRWNAAKLCLHPGAEPMAALLTAPGADGETPLVVSYTALPTDRPLQMEVFRRTAVALQGVRLEPVSLGPAASGFVHAYRAQPARLPAPPPVREPEVPADTVPAAFVMRETIERARKRSGEPSSFDVHPTTL